MGWVGKSSPPRIRLIHAYTTARWRTTTLIAMGLARYRLQELAARVLDCSDASISSISNRIPELFCDSRGG